MRERVQVITHHRLKFTIMHLSMNGEFMGSVYEVVIIIRPGIHSQLQYYFLFEFFWRGRRRAPTCVLGGDTRAAQRTEGCWLQQQAHAPAPQSGQEQLPQSTGAAQHRAVRHQSIFPSSFNFFVET